MDVRLQCFDLCNISAEQMYKQWCSFIRDDHGVMYESKELKWGESSGT